MTHFGFSIFCLSKSDHYLSQINNENDLIIYHSKDQFTTFHFEYCKNKRFSEDKFFFENQEFIIGLDGVILNLDQLKQEYLIADWKQLFISLFKKHNYLTANHLNGEFAGFVFDKQKEELYFFTNHTSSKKVYYHHEKGTTIISPSLQTVADFLHSNEKNVRLNRTSAYSLLTHGGMYGNSTLMDNVFRLHGGEYLLVTSKNLDLKKYLDYNATEINDFSEQKTIDLLEEQFQRALKLEYQKDEKYKLPHLATLSGGLDSRMNVFLAHKAGYQCTNLCFSQKGYDDEIIAKAIAKHLQQDLTFVPLDDGEYVLEFEENMAIYEGQIFYSSSAHFNYAIKKLAHKNFGLIHTGLLGDAILGTYITKPASGLPDLQAKLNSKRLFPKIEKDLEILSTQYVSEDIFNLHQRFFNVILSGAFAMEQYSYLVSPFMFPDFMKVCLSMPPKYKYQQKIYIKWMNKYHKELTKFKWESTGFKPLYAWQKPLSRYTKKTNALWHQLIGQTHKLNMTPYQYWYQNNPKIPTFMGTIFNKKIDLLANDKELYHDAIDLFRNGNALEKTMVLSLLGAIEKLKISV